MSSPSVQPPEGWHLARLFADLAPVPWANGGGRTTELVGYAESAQYAESGHFAEAVAPEWRLSIAALDRPAPFSALPGVRRTFMPADGDVTLQIADRTVHVARGTTVEFDGSDPVELVALDHPCHAINLMVKEDARTGGGSSAAEVSLAPSRTYIGCFMRPGPAVIRVHGTPVAAVEPATFDLIVPERRP